MELVRSEMKARGTAAVVVTHDGRVTEWCDRTVEISDGRIRPGTTGAGRGHPMSAAHGTGGGSH